MSTKRSFVNRVLEEARGTLYESKINLPPWAFWGPKEWADAGPEANQIRQHGLGWNFARFGNDFNDRGLLIFVSRNGLQLPDGSLLNAKGYAEKVMIVRPGQVTPYHFHWKKFEDLINRGNGRLQLQVAWAHENERELLDGELTITQDGFTKQVKAKEIITLEPGQSVELPPRLCHQFYGHPHDNEVIAGEISMTNDDGTDNCFLGADISASAIEEDEPPTFLLAADYPIFWPERQ